MPTPTLTNRRSVVALLKADPELGEALAREEVEPAERAAVARAVHLERGRWDPEEDLTETQTSLGLLVVEGLMARDLTLGDRSTTELLGSGDLLRPWDQDATLDLPLTATWTVLEPATVAILDRRFMAAISRFPALLIAITSRGLRRSRALAMRQVINQIVRLEDRLALLLWTLAERWGRMTPSGVTLTLPLTHATLARLTGARRPSVTAALGALTRDGVVERTENGFVLHGTFDDVLARVARME